MNVTYVVERGSFNEVANEMTALATKRLTEARKRSKDGIVLDGAEISACLVLRSAHVPDSKIASVKVWANKEIQVLGVYWESSNEYE